VPEETEMRVAMTRDHAVADLSRRHARRIVGWRKGEIPAAGTFQHDKRL